MALSSSVYKPYPSPSSEGFSPGVFRIYKLPFGALSWPFPATRPSTQRATWPASHIHGHWAQQKVRVSTDPEEEICSLIVKKLAGKPGVSFEEIARAFVSREQRTRLKDQ